MKARAYFAYAMSIALGAIPGLAAASDGSAVAPEARILHATPVGRVNLRDLAFSAANLAALKARASRPVAMPRHRFPGLAGAHPAAVSAMAGATQQTISRVVASPVPHGFVGTYEGSNSAAIQGELEPPDQGLTVNGGTVVEIVNNSWQAFNAAGAPLINPISTSVLFEIDPSEGLSDPHVEFDTFSQRWIFEELIYGPNFNGFAVAVSSGSDPLGTYIIYQVDADTSNIAACGGSCFPDYPQVGFNDNGFFIGADLFSNTTGNFVSAAVYALPKSSMEAGLPLDYQCFQFADFVVQPSIPVANEVEQADNGTEYLMTARNIYDNSTNLRVFAITNTNNLGSGNPGLVAHYTTVAAEPYTATVPSSEPDVVGPYGLSLGGTSSPSLDGGYNSFGGGVKYVGGKLYAALTSGAVDRHGLARDVIAWFSVAPSVTPSGYVRASIAAQGYIVPPDGYSISYPGWALDRTAAGIIGTTITSTNAGAVGGFPSAGFVRFADDKTGHTYTVTGQGAASDDGFTGYAGSGPAGVGRWGDFSSATIDAVTGRYWVGNEFIPNAHIYPRGEYANWGTFITDVP
jgi:hypothetical protein